MSVWLAVLFPPCTMLEVSRKAAAHDDEAGVPPAALPEPLERVLPRHVLNSTLAWHDRHAVKRSDAGRHTANLQVSKASSGGKDFLAISVMPHFL
jgi:hypothetical protein